MEADGASSTQTTRLKIEQTLSDDSGLASELIEIAQAITQERDVHALLGLILDRSRFLTGADAASIYVLEGTSADPRERKLHFMLSQNDSVDFESKEFVIPVSHRSIAGAAVLGKGRINIEDVYQLDASTPYEFDSSYDQKSGYRTRSVLAVPLISAKDEVIGVIQLINKKRDPGRQLSSLEDVDREVVPFDRRSEEVLQIFAAQAGIALENALLYDEIQRIFEGFVHASVQAIEQRDPTTSGHSWRVSVLSCKLAEQVDGVREGVYRDARFDRTEMRELEYAALLHDFGKIGVREQVLVKAHKLYPHQLEAIRARIDFAIGAAEREMLQKKLTLVREGAPPQDLAVLDQRFQQRRQQLEDAWHTIQMANSPSVLQQGESSRIAELATLAYVDVHGEQRLLLDTEEVAALQVRRGSLVASELEEIRSHVVHTYNFLAQVPWGKSMARIPAIAGAHHERLDGTGYPHGARDDAIPLQAKIMSIADIYDALTASDRPYKKALPSERALEILDLEVADGHVDGELVRIFREAGVHLATAARSTY